MDWFEKSFEHAPALAAMVAIVFGFLRFLKQINEMHGNRTQEFVAAMKEIHNDNSRARELTRQVIERNTAALELTAAILNKRL